MQSCFGYGTIIDAGFAKLDLSCIEVASFFFKIFYLECLKSMPHVTSTLSPFLKTKKSYLLRIILKGACVIFFFVEGFDFL